MDVTVETQCSRCDRKEEKRVSLEEAQAMEQAEKTRESHQQTIIASLQEQLQQNVELSPDFVLIRRTTQGFDVRILNDLCHIPNAKRNKGCEARVELLVKEIFMENPKPKTKDKGKGKGKDNGKGKDKGKGEGGEK